jgi:hypothetical protein
MEVTHRPRKFSAPVKRQKALSAEKNWLAKPLKDIWNGLYSVLSHLICLISPAFHHGTFHVVAPDSWNSELRTRIAACRDGT